MTKGGRDTRKEHRCTPIGIKDTKSEEKPDEKASKQQKKKGRARETRENKVGRMVRHREEIRTGKETERETERWRRGQRDKDS